MTQWLVRGQVFDGYFVKYFASVVALLVYGAPIYFRDPSKRGSQDDLTQDYIRSMRLLQNTSRCVTECPPVHKLAAVPNGGAAAAVWCHWPTLLACLHMSALVRMGSGHALCQLGAQGSGIAAPSALHAANNMHWS